ALRGRGWPVQRCGPWATHSAPPPRGVARTVAGSAGNGRKRVGRPRLARWVSAIKHFQSASPITAAPGWACAHVSRRWRSQGAEGRWEGSGGAGPQAGGGGRGENPPFPLGGGRGEKNRGTTPPRGAGPGAGLLSPPVAGGLP